MASSFDHGRGALRIHAVVVVAGLRCDATEASAASDVLSEGLGGGVGGPLEFIWRYDRSGLGATLRLGIVIFGVRSPHSEDSKVHQKQRNHDSRGQLCHICTFRRLIIRPPS